MVNVEAVLRTSLADRYEIEDEIGHGGMSVVFRAHDLKHNRTVAIKVLRPELSQQIGAERFQREIEVVAGLTHPHILPLHDSGEADGLLFYVMPFVEGGSLRERIEADGALPEADALRFTREIADALGHAHKYDVIHRDVKPGNILLSGDHALLADFGVAHLASGVHETLTEAGLALGTPAYLSPEQASGERQIDGRSDIYSLGCVLYEALTGSPPFSADSIRAMLVHQMVDTPPSVRSLNEGISPGAEAIVDTAISKEPDARFQTGEQMVQALEALGADSREIPGLYSWSVGALQSLSVRARLAILAAALIIVLVLILRPPDPPQTGPVRYLVVEHVGENASRTERAIAAEAAKTLRRQLRNWKRSVSVVSAVAMEGSTADLQVAGVARGSLLFGANLAEDLEVDFLVVVEADDLHTPGGFELDPDPGRVEILVRPFDSGGAAGANSDSAYTAVEIHAVRRDQRRDGEDRDFTASGRVDSLAVLTADIALQLLGIEGNPMDYPTLLARSSDHLAQQEFQAGKDALRDWRLAEARRHFEAAISRDSTFALAHHLLAETMYWQTEQSAELMEELGPRIESHSRQADWRGSEENLRPLEREAVDAFRAFWTGEYDLARDRYDSLIFADSTDLEALVLRGAVEFEDMMLLEESDGTLLPRRNLNVARNVFQIADMLNPRWHLAWGHLHSITRQIAESVWLGKCPGFELPGEEMVAPWVVREASEQRYFCPVFVADTIAWTPYQPDELPGDSASWAAAARLHAETLEALERNTLRGLGHARHHEELAGFVLEELGLFPCESQPARNDSLRQLARRHLAQAVEARQDTTPQELITLAAIDLGDGYVAPAMAMTARALDQLGDWKSLEGTPPPTEAANAFLAAGRVEVVLDILHRAYARRTTSILDPLNDGRFIDTFGTMGTLLELQAMGVLGETGPPVDERVDLVLRTWADAPLPDTDRMLLRVGTLEYVGPALAHSEALWQRWFDGWSELEWEVPPVWRGLIAAAESPLDPAEARSQLYAAVAALGAYPDDDPVEAIDLYLPVLLAERIGATDVEMELRRRMSQCELNYGQFDAGWGAVRSLGLLE